MTTKQKITTLFSRDIIQRFCYLMALIGWMAIWFVNLQLNYYNSSFDLKNVCLIIVPIGLLVFQIAYNRRTLWLSILGVTGIYSLWKFFNLITSLIINLNREYLKVTFNIKEVLIITLTILAIIAINWVVIKIKPYRSKEESF